MDRLIARINIRYYRDMLLSDLVPEVRLRVHKLLVQEEDKLAKDLELLVEIERHIGEGARRIEAQQARVHIMRANRHNGVKVAQAFLDGMMESQQISMEYRQLVKKEIERNRFLEK
jgi:hypothetical protein